MYRITATDPKIGIGQQRDARRARQGVGDDDRAGADNGRQRRREGRGAEEGRSKRASPPAAPTITTPRSRSSTRRWRSRRHCFDCQFNIGVAYMAKKDEKAAEEAWKKALEMKADYAEALNALSTLYNNQKRFDEAAAMSAKAAAAGGGGRQRRRDVQPGHHPLEPGQDRRGQGEVRRDDQGEPNARRRALSARHGAAERRQARPKRSPNSKAT